jgi:hypothetical protein
VIDDRLTRQLRHIVDANLKTAAARAAAIAAKDAAEKPPGDQWWHADHIDEDGEDLDVDPIIEPGIPASLAEALEDWLTEEATEKELTALIGPVPPGGKGS